MNVLVQSSNCKNKDIYLDHDEKDQVTLTYLKKHKMKPKNFQRHFLDDIYGLIAGVKAGLGRAIVPMHLIKGQNDIEIIDSKNSLEIPVYLYYFSRPFYTKLHQHIVEHLKNMNLD